MRVRQAKPFQTCQFFCEYAKMSFAPFHSFNIGQGQQYESLHAKWAPVKAAEVIAKMTTLL